MTSPHLPLVRAQWSFLSGIRPSRELHGSKVKVTAPPIKNQEVRNSLGFTIRYLVFSQVIINQRKWTAFKKKPSKWPYHSLYVQVKNFQFSESHSFNDV
jgi:hypothetical protein